MSGGIELLMPVWGGAPDAAPGGADWLRWLWTVGLIVLAALWLALAPGASARCSEALRTRPGASVALGFVWLVCVPVLSLLLLLTIIGIPLALFALALYLAVLPLAYVAAAVGVGDWVLHRWRATLAAALRWRLAAGALALLLLMLLGQVAWLGVLVPFALLLAGLGALLLAWRRPRPAAGA